MPVGVMWVNQKPTAESKEIVKRIYDEVPSAQIHQAEGEVALLILMSSSNLLTGPDNATVSTNSSSANMWFRSVTPLSRHTTLSLVGRISLHVHMTDDLRGLDGWILGRWRPGVPVDEESPARGGGPSR